MVPGTTELLQKLSQAETEEDKEAVKAAIVGGTITAIYKLYYIFCMCSLCKKYAQPCSQVSAHRIELVNEARVHGLANRYTTTITV